MLAAFTHHRAVPRAHPVSIAHHGSSSIERALRADVAGRFNSQPDFTTQHHRRALRGLPEHSGVSHA
jgi:hypothetical protein